MKTVKQMMCGWVVLLALVLVTNPLYAQVTKTTYYHVNLQGTPVAATDEAGAVKWKQYYSTFGYHDRNEGQLNDVNSMSIGLAGHVEDQYEDLLLVYMQARYYDPMLGRFLSMDPVGFRETNPQSFNRYVYANNNPQRYVDPDGNDITSVLTDLAPAAGRAFGGLAAYGVGYVTGDEALMRVAVEGMAEQQAQNLAAIATTFNPFSSVSKLKKLKCSFDGGTEVLTDEGYLPIRDLDNNAVVLAQDEITGDQYWRPVLHHYSNEYEDTVYLSLEEVDTGLKQVITSNKIHPFFVVREGLSDPNLVRVAHNVQENNQYYGPIENGAWIQAANLQDGDLLLTVSGDWVEVINVEVVEKPLTAYNLDVADNDNYFVRGVGSADSAVWVHNCNKGLVGNPMFKHAVSQFKRAGWTNAGRHASKHPNVLGVNVPKDQVLKALIDKFGSQAGVNRAAADALKNIMRNGIRSTKDTKAFGNVTEFKLENGIGARFNSQTNEFIGFLGRGL